MLKRVFIILLVLAAIAGVFFYFYKSGKILGKKSISEGVIEYDITYPKMDANNSMASTYPSKAYLYFKDNLTMNEMSGMMGLFRLTYAADQSMEKVTQTLTILGTKVATELVSEAVKNLNKTYIKSIDAGKNSEKIAGFNCKEAIATLQTGETIHVYYTNDIGIFDPNWSNPYFKVSGVLMDFQLERYGITMHLKAKTVTPQKIDDSLFTIPADFKMVEYEEMEKILLELNP